MTSATASIKTDIDVPPKDPISQQPDNPNLTDVPIDQKQIYDDQEVKDSLQRHELAIEKILQAIDRLTIMHNSVVLTEPTTSLSDAPTIPSSTTDHATKQLRSKQISQLFESTAFSGSRSQDVVDWLDEFNQKCDDIRLDDTQRLSIARGLMKNDAKLWVDALKHTLIDWKIFQQRLIAYFQLAAGIDGFSFSEQLYTRQQQLHESAIQYYHDVIRLCSKVDVNMDNATRLKHLYRGLRPETKITIDIRKFNNPDDFLQELVRFEQLQKDCATEAHEPVAMMSYQSNKPSLPNESVRHPNTRPFQQRSYYEQQYHERGPLASSRPRRGISNSYPSRSSPQYRNQQSSSSQDANRHLNRW